MRSVAFYVPTYFGHASLIIRASASQVEFYLQRPACAADLLAHLAFDQAAKLSNQTCALCGKGCESLVLICEISTDSGVTGLRLANTTDPRSVRR